MRIQLYYVLVGIVISISLAACATKRNVLYPICAYQPVSQDQWNIFDSAVGGAIKYHFGDDANFFISKTDRTLTVEGKKPQHLDFVDWVSVEACLPKYRDKQSLGQYATCSQYIDEAAAEAVDRVFAQDKDVRRASAKLIRKMYDANQLCHRDWSGHDVSVTNTETVDEVGREPPDEPVDLLVTDEERANE